MNLGLQGKIAVITGGTRGIGLAIAKSLAEEGVVPLITFSSDEGVAGSALKELQKINSQARAFRFNVSHAKEVQTAFEQIIKSHRKIDILVNNAGITKDNLLLRMKEEDWDQVLDVNLKGVFLCSQMALRSMIKERWGRIINISSVVGDAGNPGQVNYAASKGGILSFTKALAREIASRSITVNAITPGYIETEMTLHLPEKVKQAMLDAIPLKKFGNPSDVGAVVSFLASEKSAYITGQVFGVNGGLYM